jgi:hypothetical protein
MHPSSTSVCGAVLCFPPQPWLDDPSPIVNGPVAMGNPTDCAFAEFERRSGYQCLPFPIPLR